MYYAREASRPKTYAVHVTLIEPLGHGLLPGLPAWVADRVTDERIVEGGVTSEVTAEKTDYRDGSATYTVRVTGAADGREAAERT